MLHTAQSDHKLNFLKIALFCCGIVCTQTSVVHAADKPSNRVNASEYFVSDIEGIKESMLFPEFWQKNLSHPGDEILSSSQIHANNIRLLERNPNLTFFQTFPSSMSAKDISNKILALSKKPKSNRYDSNGKQVTDQQFDQYIDSLNIGALPKQQIIQFGLVVIRSNLRTFPTDNKVFKTPDNVNLDRFQETASFPTEIAAVLHESKDKQWFFVTTYNYSAWIKKSNIAIGSKQEILDYKSSHNFIVVTGDKVFTTSNPYDNKISEIQLDMGVSLPLVNKNDIPTTIGGQNTYTQFVVKIPTRDNLGKLNFKLAMIQKNKDVSVGYLPFTRENIVSQAFKFLGERYGWGHSLNARDCTGFVGDVYKSFGILMPRNTGQQASSQQGDNIAFAKNSSRQEKLKEIEKLQAGDLIYIPGHVMMFMGLQNGKPYIIHDVSGLSYYKENGEYYKSALNGVSITPLLPLQLNQESSYLDRIYNLKKIK